MIQRKQTLFLLVAAVLGVITLSLPIATVTDQGLTVSQIYNLLWLDSQHVAHFGVWPLFAILLLASALSLYTIFIYRRRPQQATLCLGAMALYVAWYLALIVVSKMQAPDALNFHLDFPAALPAVSAILCFMARKGVLADEKLVRAADRIR
jgi:uncharacterized BrkB/YihY/UPF0761 family membrane protein